MNDKFPVYMSVIYGPPTGYADIIGSDDGSTWDVVGKVPSTIIDPRILKYINGRLFCIGYNTKLGMLYTDDLITWKQSSGLPTVGERFEDISTDGTILVTRSQLGSYISNDNGESWSFNQDDKGLFANKIDYSNDVFVCANNANMYGVSSNGIEWTTGTFPVMGNYSVLRYGLGKFHAFDGSTHIATSDSGLVWYTETLKDTISATGACFSDDKGIVVSGRDGRYAYKVNGGEWINGVLPVVNVWQDVEYSSYLNRFVVVSSNANGNIAYSDDIVSWDIVETPTKYGTYSIVATR